MDINNPQATPLKINFKYNNSFLEEIIIDKSSFCHFYDFEPLKLANEYYLPELNFNGFFPIEDDFYYDYSVEDYSFYEYRRVVEILRLPSFHYLNSAEFFAQIGFSRIQAQYESGKISSITFLNENNLILDKIFFFHNDNFHHDCIEKKKTTDCFKIIKGQIEKIFSHEYYY